MQNPLVLNFLRAHISVFLFAALVIFSVAFFVHAESGSSSQSIFEDADQDNLTNAEEKLYGTDPHKKDTDGDGYSDGVEIESGYDPLKPAPGDRIATGSVASAPGLQAGVASGENLTAQVSQHIASVLQNAGGGGDEVSLEEVNAAVQEILSGAAEDDALPEVDIKEIRIKRAPSSSLGEKERKERERQDVLEYLTTVSYIMANNSPSKFDNEDELGSLLGSLTDQSVVAIASGNLEYIGSLSERGGKILEETKDIEVPESMLDVHVKALKMAKYAQALESDLAPRQDDPLGQIATLSKLQGLLSVVAQFSEEVHGVLQEHDIEEIPLDI